MEDYPVSNSMACMLTEKDITIKDLKTQVSEEKEKIKQLRKDKALMRIEMEDLRDFIRCTRMRAEVLIKDLDRYIDNWEIPPP